MLYIHIPICTSKCHYCGFYSIASLGVDSSALLAALSRELESRCEEYTEPLKTIYFGGGTPSMLTASELSAIFDTIKRNYDTSIVSEVTLEANPEHLSDNYLHSLRSMGVNRLSMGVQSFSDERLKYIGRKHSAQNAIDAIGRAQRAGFDNISLDLMFGFEDLSSEEWQRSIEAALSLGVQHISAYQLTIEKNTIFARKGISTASDEICFEQYQTLCTMLKAAGFDHYEISNFSLPDYHSKHNSAYWTGEKYIGIGPSAHSYDGKRCRSWNISSLKSYINAPQRESEILSDADLHNEYLMTRLRTKKGLSLSDYTSRFSYEIPHRARLQQANGRVYISEEDLFVSDEIIGSLFL